MTDLVIYPDSYLSAPIVEKEKLSNGWTICVLENGKFIYFDRFGFLFEIREEHFKWNRYWSSKIEDLNKEDNFNYYKQRNTLEPFIVEKILDFMRDKKLSV